MPVPLCSRPCGTMTCVLFDLDCSPVHLDSRLWHDSVFRDWDSLNPTPFVGLGMQSSRGGFWTGGLSAHLVSCVANFVTMQPRGLHAHVHIYGVTDGNAGLEVLFGPPSHQWLLMPGQHFFFVLAHQHWAVLELTFDENKLSVKRHDGKIRHSLSYVDALILDHFFDHFGLVAHSIQFVHEIAQARPDSCGTVALGHFALAIHAIGVAVEKLHAGLAISSLNSARRSAATRIHIGFGFSAQEQDDLDNLKGVLQSHGVPLNAAADRAQQGFRKLGAKAIHEALCSSKPWAALKEVASRPQHSFQWVRSEELQAQIRARGESKFKIQPSMKRHQGVKKRFRESQTPVQVDPTQLQLMPGTFEVDQKR